MEREAAVPLLNIYIDTTAMQRVTTVSDLVGLAAIWRGVAGSGLQG